MGIISLRCDYCGGNCEIDPSMRNAFCMHCGTKLIIRDDTYNVTLNVESPQSASLEKNVALMWRYFERGEIHKVLEESAAILNVDPTNIDALEAEIDCRFCLMILDALSVDHDRNPYQFLDRYYYADYPDEIGRDPGARDRSYERVFDFMTNSLMATISSQLRDPAQRYILLRGDWPEGVQEGRSAVIFVAYRRSKGLLMDRAKNMGRSNAHIVYRILSRLDPEDDYSQYLQETYPCGITDAIDEENRWNLKHPRGWGRRRKDVSSKGSIRNPGYMDTVTFVRFLLSSSHK